MSNNSQLIDMWVVVYHGNSNRRFQVREDGRGGAYVIYGEEEDRIYFDEFSLNMPVGGVFYIKSVNITFLVVENKHWIDPLKEKNMTEEHKGLPVLGYPPQSDEKVKLANTNKEYEERCLRRIEWFENQNKTAYEDFLLKLRVINDVSTTLPVFTPPYDPQMLIDAKIQIRQAFMWFNRAIFQPARISLSEDSEAWTHGDGDVS